MDHLVVVHGRLNELKFVWHLSWTRYECKFTIQGEVSRGSIRCTLLRYQVRRTRRLLERETHLTVWECILFSQLCTTHCGRRFLVPFLSVSVQDFEESIARTRSYSFKGHAYRVVNESLPINPLVQAARTRSRLDTWTKNDERKSIGFRSQCDRYSYYVLSTVNVFFLSMIYSSYFCY